MGATGQAAVQHVESLRAAQTGAVLLAAARAALGADQDGAIALWAGLAGTGAQTGIGFEQVTTNPGFDIRNVQVRILPRPDGKYVMFEMFEHL